MKLKILSSALAFLFVAGHAMAESKKEARVTQIVREVKILPADAAARAAVVNDRVADDSGVRTGGGSRSELTFADLTITRLGANTIFSFNKAGRNAQVEQRLDSPPCPERFRRRPHQDERRDRRGDRYDGHHGINARRQEQIDRLGGRRANFPG